MSKQHKKHLLDEDQNAMIKSDEEEMMTITEFLERQTTMYYNMTGPFGETTVMSIACEKDDKYAVALFKGMIGLFETYVVAFGRKKKDIKGNFGIYGPLEEAKRRYLLHLYKLRPAP